MSIQATNWVWENADVDDPRKLLVLLAIADAANRDGTNAYPGIRTIARYARCSERTAQRCLRDLEAEGHIIITKTSRQHAPVTYSVCGLAPDTTAPRGDIGVTPEPETHFARGDTGVTSENSRGDTGVTNPASAPLIGNKNVEQEPCPPSASERAPRQRDEVWEAVLQLCGIPLDAPLTKSERGKYNAAVKELKDVGATPAEISRRVRAYRTTWPGISVTPNGIVANWSTLDATVPREERPRTPKAWNSIRRHYDSKAASA